MILFGILVAAFTGNLEAVNNSILESTSEAVSLLTVMLGVISMWNGFLFIAEESGLTKVLSQKMKPLICFLFPDIPEDDPANSYICANFIANLLGLGWACTPTGLKAMEALQALERKRGNSDQIASNEMCTFLLVNISSLQLIPINMIAYRARYGSPSPTAIVGPSLVATFLTTLLAFLLSKLLSRHKE